jgi:membrane protease YdiL (CAAX protease family)
MATDTFRDPALERRLQRKASAKGSFVATFRQVFLRHGLTMGFVALACLFLPSTLTAIRWGSVSLLSAPFFYLTALSTLLLFCLIFLLFKGHKINQIEVAWIAYLLFISTMEEFAFRLILPNLLAEPIGVFPAAIASNLLFACIHFITLRWKFINCIGVFFAGLGLSRLMVNTEDIAFVVLVHLFFTFLNTPTPPNHQAKAEASKPASQQD